MNLPNKLTVFRTICIPFFVFFLLADFVPCNYLIALIVFIIASLTDLFDGKIARKYNLVTNFGKFMDPLADKLLVCAALISLDALFVSKGYAGNVWFTVSVIIIISRELFISGFRILAADQNVVLAAGWWGKVKTVLQMVMTIVMIIYLQASDWIKTCNVKIPASVMSGVGIFIQVLVAATLFFTVFSMIDYVIKNKEVLKN
ncbi:MAG: CDP-diacylglycerol--glycerol-3-phosphate 3-phosphatidyltransferase [Eubacterium sp.]|nr:CDP-diacylglycerol--glycerol-3-phosphate 3-phosphatidyltransferase [Eubacterium sp.]